MVILLNLQGQVSPCKYATDLKPQDGFRERKRPPFNPLKSHL